jgi:hypothetical protein
MKHSRTGEELTWTRVAEYDHVSKRLWTLGELLVGKCCGDCTKQG